MRQALSFEVMKRDFKGKTTLEILWNFADFGVVKSRNFVVVGSLGLEPRTIRL